MVAQRYNSSTEPMPKTVVGAKQKSYRAHANSCQAFANSRQTEAENLRASPKWQNKRVNFPALLTAIIVLTAQVLTLTCYFLLVLTPVLFQSGLATLIFPVQKLVIMC